MQNLLKFNLPSLRTKKGFTQERLAREIGCSLNNIQSYESGDKKQYSHKTLERICRVLDCHPSELFGWK